MNLTDTLSLTGKRALITGAAKGIGAAIAQLFAERGASLFLLDIDEANLETTASQLRDLGLEVQAIVADVAETERVTKLLADSRTEIDILINNAGISGREAAFEKIGPVNFDRMMDIHVKGAFFITQQVVPGMISRGGGRIINISSNRGMVGYRRSSHYCAAKAALLGLTKAWAKELAPHRILVNAVAPGVVFTEMNTWNGMAPLEEEASWNLLNRWAEPMEIAYLVAYLASEQAAFITGQVVSPNGGDPIVGI
jgi:NAD(P)-dependent dehydrogenase (short-subunit alcohol dehydrogenase family)